MKYALLALLLPIVCAVASEPSASAAPLQDGWQPAILLTGSLNNASATADLWVYLPKGYTQRSAAQRYPLAIALHGWGHSPEIYREQGNLAQMADVYGIVLAVPAMGKTVYETRYYPESRRKWAEIPGAPWVAEVVLPHMRKHFSVTQKAAQTGIFGYSTGGHGAILVAERYSEFGFAGSLSGTYDLMQLPTRSGEYRIHRRIYQSRNVHPERWRRDSCVSGESLRGLRQTSLYVAHGSADPVVSASQLKALQSALKTPKRTAIFELVDGAGHDWVFWKAYTQPLFAAMSRAFRQAP